MAVKFEDLFLLVGGFGRWQFLTLFCASLSGFFLTFNHSGYVYHSYQPDHWCEVPQFSPVNWTLENKKDISIPKEERNGKLEYSRCYMFDRNYTLLHQENFHSALNLTQGTDTSIIPCTSWEFDDSVFTLTTAVEWNLVCENTAWRPAIQSIYMLGVLSASLVFGPMADKIGRKKTLMIAVLASIPLVTCTAFVPNFPAFLAIRYFTGMTVTGIYATSYVILLEIVSPSKRAITTILFDIGPSIGAIVWAGVSYNIPDWRALYFTVGCASSVFLMYFWTMPESPRWLIINGREKEAIELLRRAARMNKMELSDPKELDRLVREFQKSEIVQTDGPVTKLERLKRVFVLWRTPEMRFRSVTVFWTWFGISLVAFGIGLVAARLPLSIHLIMLVSALKSLLARVLSLWPINHLGRKKIFSSCFLFISACVAALLFVPADLPYVSWVIIMISGLGISMNFSLVYLYTAELFPTEVRSLAVNMGSLHARIGAILTPFIVDLLGVYNRSAPLIIFLVVSLMSAVASLFLPETIKQTLPETVADVEKRGKARRNRKEELVIVNGKQNDETNIPLQKSPVNEK